VSLHHVTDKSLTNYLDRLTDISDSLGKLMPVTMDASRRSECLPNTRVDILNFIVDWVKDPLGKQNTLWLYGLAGSGKSTLSTTIANIFNDSGQLGAFLFFERDVAERSDPTIVIRTLAHQLAASNPALGEAIRSVVEQLKPTSVTTPPPVSETHSGAYFSRRRYPSEHCGCSGRAR